jgi:hypothetical protein
MTRTWVAVLAGLLVVLLALGSRADEPPGIEGMAPGVAFRSADVVAFVRVLAGATPGPVYRVLVLDAVKGLNTRKGEAPELELLVKTPPFGELLQRQEYLVYLWRADSPSSADSVVVRLGGNSSMPWYEVRLGAPHPDRVCDTDSQHDCVNRSEELARLHSFAVGR